MTDRVTEARDRAVMFPASNLLAYVDAVREEARENVAEGAALLLQAAKNQRDVLGRLAALEARVAALESQSDSVSIPALGTSVPTVTDSGTALPMCPRCGGAATGGSAPPFWSYAHEPGCSVGPSLFSAPAAPATRGEPPQWDDIAVGHPPTPHMYGRHAWPATEVSAPTPSERPEPAKLVDGPIGRDDAFDKALEDAINRHSKENGSDTPDFILATFLRRVLTAFDVAVRERTGWYLHSAPPSVPVARLEALIEHMDEKSSFVSDFEEGRARQNGYWIKRLRAEVARVKGETGHG